ncbi:MAG: MoaD/ThiS family protein [Anaerolineae bacterium]|nr:MoaD/ThiS family protein [Anaerolineae bacterium]
MQVKVKLYANLQKYAPEGTALGEAFPVKLPEKSTIADLIAVLNIRANEVKVAYVNGRARAELYRLQEGDDVGIFSPVGGG